ncbi:TetR/AcrR family transcriptional regulator [Streptosporangium jomthongense]|uniref:TetR/AcrR family transcriptional regulator n=1 Tax=Streptosporangium jomthongense TaxID=1193683 RepID=A0ABV8FF60_9ACTN
MTTPTPQSRRRRQVLSRERIIEAAVGLLDTAGAGALTVRALSERLSTGSGAIYHHVGNMGELLQAATESVVVAALPAPQESTTDPGTEDTGRERIRAAALGLYDAVAEHPWLAVQLAVQVTRSPWGTVTPRIFESIGGCVRTLGVPRSDWFATTSTLVHYILGATSQNAQSSDTADDVGVPRAGARRAEFLDSVSKAWKSLDAGDHPFLHDIADQMRGHDDREQFLTGIDLILAGITAVSRPS